MGLVTGVTLPNDGDEIRSSDYNDPINKILAEVNGNLDSTNIKEVSGSKLTQHTVPATALDDSAHGGWAPLSAAFTVASGYNQGNKSFVLDSNTDLTGTVSKGMRFKIDRGIAPPTKSIDLEASSSQYASKASPSGITFTDDFTCEAWIKLESYGSDGEIIARTDATNANGFHMRISAAGAVLLECKNGGSSNFRNIASYQSIPLGVWVHVAATIDMSGWTTATNAIYINGVSVPIAFTTSGSNPTSFVQSGDLSIGKNGPGNYFDGEIADARVWSTVRTATQIQDNMNQQLTGSETGLVGYWKLNGDWNDSTANANNLTPVASPSFVTDNPMNDTEFAIVTDVTATQVTVFTGTDYNIPNMTLSSPYYSAQRTPFGFPASRGKWVIETLYCDQDTKNTPTPLSYYTLGNLELKVPVGQWNLYYSVTVGADGSVQGRRDSRAALSTSSSSASDRWMISAGLGIASNFLCWHLTKEGFATVEATTTYYLIVGTAKSAGSVTTLYLMGDPDENPIVVRAECAYL